MRWNWLKAVNRPRNKPTKSLYECEMFIVPVYLQNLQNRDKNKIVFKIGENYTLSYRPIK